MELSTETQNILKNFSEINQSLAFKQGKILKTVSPQKNILAQAEVTEEFPKDFAVYELNKFLGTLAMFNKATFDFNSDHVKIIEGNKRVKYVYADPSMFVAPPEKQIEFPEAEIQFTLTQVDLDSLMRASAVLHLPEVGVIGNGSKMELTVMDVNNSSTDELGIEVGTTDKTFQVVFKHENIKLMRDDYDVQISSRGIAHFKAKGVNVQYWIATESSSKFS
ncbi:uncharacterized protein METZ01_LOCUS31952 [marine metagenome]|jgi:hypothetical protein|uniref:Sliding clamp C-terminal domain-containing protein n=1 Tax=marine metagenome TaxID=408172 RepID=A0A381QJK1_9ZZZZ|tara:strand:+ start:2673 stop:3335 length:663 start_codon:yes stop_codon:yes gene_type:complete